MAALGDIFRQCRAGDFSGTVELLELMEPRTDDMLSSMRPPVKTLAPAAYGKSPILSELSFAALDPFGLDNALAIADALSTDGP